MGKQTIRQEARRAALDAQSKRREERAERERRVEALAIKVLVAIREREAADRRAGEALTEMIETERLSAREAVQWCGDEVSTREVARLRRVAADAADQAAQEDDGAGADTGADVPTSAAP